MNQTEKDTAANHSSAPGETPHAPVTYTFDNRAYIVQPVFKDKPANTLSTVLLRLMQADLEKS